METLDLADIQGLIARGYGQLRAARFLLLEIADPAAARRWLGPVADRVTAAQARPAATALHLAFTATGLAKLGLPAELLAMFSNEFRDGMTTPHRQRILGDVGPSAPSSWRWGGPATRPVDALLLLYAADESALAELAAAQVAALPAGGLAVVATLETADLDDREPFGFRDGISQPFIEGLSKTGPAFNTVRAGEFILGYRNEYGLLTDRPLVRVSDDPRHLLPDDPGGSGNRDLGRNGSYLVVRQLEQDVRGFWRFLDRATRTPDGSPDPARRTWLAAKMVGRWPGGAPLVAAPERDDPALADANDFRYHQADRDGLHCPIGAHIRRANPRDSLDPEPGTDQSIALNKRHRLLRRGREYGPPLSVEAAVSGAEDGADAERGLHFICLNANIARQFELVQHTWVNNPKFDELYDEVDPLVGLRGPAGATFAVPAAPVRRRVTGLPAFVTVRGGAYFFLPGIRALRYLAALG